MLIQKYSRTLFALQVSNEVRGNILATVVDRITGTMIGLEHAIYLIFLYKIYTFLFFIFTIIYTPFLYFYIHFIYILLYNYIFLYTSTYLYILLYTLYTFTYFIYFMHFINKDISPLFKLLAYFYMPIL